ncbi:ATPase domain-containing protein [Nitrosococcus wardiae]|uniref:non-specific serine/threonine protein kinase n=1 Tax=Nitrosococcus wardiae TaxID=1814290 RepID=A0A4P7C090_9GAMM|nr:ATPase domain-containing protein [Nitrosococcus wardiae]QBQ54979.1 circadian clock protein KaiC [Nitrosococcus wardiae]
MPGPFNHPLTSPRQQTARIPTGVPGLDAVLGGGLPGHHTYLVEGGHGAGKTMLSLQFCIAGAQRGERVLYLSTCESEEDIREIAHAHDWSLEGVHLHYLDPQEILGETPAQSVFHPAEIELPQMVDTLLSVIAASDPQRLVIDSLAEIRLLADSPRWFRSQVLALGKHLADRSCTILFCDDQLDERESGQSIVHGVIRLEQRARDYGPDRRRLRITKLRGHPFYSGYHDMAIRTGGLEVYPRLVAAEHRQEVAPAVISSGLPELDALFGGGIDRSTATLLLGPSGTGKSILASQFAVAAAGRGERAALYLFDERVHTFLRRAQGLGIDLTGQRDRGRIELQQVDPAEMTPGEFSHQVQQAITERDVRLVVIDSLAGYAHAMPDERWLTLHLHELLAYLSQQQITVLLVMAQHGLPGTPRHVSFDLSYIADSVLLFHAFEYAGEIRKVISAYKRRGGAHEAALRELRFGPKGIGIGAPLRQFEGILTGTPHFTGEELTPIDPHHDQS